MQARYCKRQSLKLQEEAANELLLLLPCFSLRPVTTHAAAADEYYCMSGYEDTHHMGTQRPQETFWPFSRTESLLGSIV